MKLELNEDATVANVLVIDLHDLFYHRVLLSCLEADAVRAVTWARRRPRDDYHFGSGYIARRTSSTAAR